MNPKALRQLELKVENFNLKFKVGDKVKLQKDDGKIEEVTIRHPATVFNGHSAVGWFDEISGCCDLDRVRS